MRWKRIAIDMSCKANEPCVCDDLEGSRGDIISEGSSLVAVKSSGLRLMAR